MTRFLLNCLLLTALIGCSGPDATVQGIVTIDGQLARRGAVVFHRLDGGPMAYGSIADNGSYALRVGQGNLGGKASDDDEAQIVSGDYVVTVVVNMPSGKDETGESGPPRPGARLTAKKYASKETSGLRVNVKPGPNVVPLELEGAAVDEVEEEPDAQSEDDATETDQTDQTESEEAAAPPAESTLGSTPPVGENTGSERAEPEEHQEPTK